MKEKLKTQTVKLISLQEWDDFVISTYGKPYSFQQQDGCKERGIERFSVPHEWEDDYENTSIPFDVDSNEMGVKFETWLNTSPEDTVEYFTDNYCSPGSLNNLFWTRNFYPDVSMIVNDLHFKGLLEEGEYVIVIDW
jgi:hypothetical protein